MEDRRQTAAKDGHGAALATRTVGAGLTRPFLGEPRYPRAAVMVTVLGTIHLLVAAATVFVYHELSQGTVRVETNPVKADVTIDGGALPAESRLLPHSFRCPPGRHTVSVTSPGYTGHQTEVMVKAGEIVPLYVSLVPSPLPLPPRGDD
jgi:hypothetical protein